MSLVDALRALRGLLEFDAAEKTHLDGKQAILEQRFLPILAEELKDERDLLRKLTVALASSKETPLSVVAAQDQGALIAIEGIDGAGKGTQANLLLQQARETGLRVERLSFPRYGETVFSRLIADYLNGRFGTIDTVPPQFSALLFAGDRFESVPHLKELLDQNDLVVLDRYVSSNVAYHAARVSTSGRREFIDWLYRVEFGTFKLPIPSVNLLLDVPVVVTRDWVLRKGVRSYTTRATDIHEQRLDYMERCREMFLLLCRDSRYGHWNVIKCTDNENRPIPPKSISDDTWSTVRAYLVQRGVTVSRRS